MGFCPLLTLVLTLASVVCQGARANFCTSESSTKVNTLAICGALTNAYERLQTLTNAYERLSDGTRRATVPGGDCLGGAIENTTVQNRQQK